MAYEVTWEFDGEAFPVVQMPNGTPGVPLRQMAKHLGLEPRAQQRMIERSSWSEGGAVVMAAPSAGGIQDAFVLDYRLVPMWLANVATSRVKDPAGRDRIVRWQREAAEALYRYVSDGVAISPNATTVQLDAAAEAVEELRRQRRAEMTDYRTVLHQIREAGGEGRDYADVQNSLYLALFGHTAKTIMKRQPQVNGERYKVGKRKGELRPSAVAKDYLTEDQLKRLNLGVMNMTTRLALRHPDGRAALGDIQRAALEVGRDIAGGR